MTLKYSFKTIKNNEHNEKGIKSKLETIDALKKCARVLNLKIKERDEEEAVEEDEEAIEYDRDLTIVHQKIRERLRNSRSYLKELQREPAFIKEIHLTSDKEWTLYSEQRNNESGLTSYQKPIKYKVDVHLPYVKDVNLKIKDAIQVEKNKALAELKEYRKESRNILYDEKEFVVEGLPIMPTYKAYMGGGRGGQARSVIYKDALRGTEYKYELNEVRDNYFIHMEGGTFLELQKVKELKKMFEKKAPLTNAHHVGIEIEFVSKLDKLEIAKALYEENVQDFVCIVDDPSIRKVPGFDFCHELTIVAPEQLINMVLQRSLKAINKDGASQVGGRCGLHVHLDMRNRDKKIAYHNLVKAQRILYAMNPRVRLDGTTVNGKIDTVWSKKVDVEDFDVFWTQLGGPNGEGAGHEINENRYYGINILSLNRHNTIEIRIHSGSTNFEKISNWVKILTSIVSLTNKVETEAAKPETFCEYYGLDNNILEYIKERIAKFKDKNGKHITLDEAC